MPGFFIRCTNLKINVLQLKRENMRFPAYVIIFAAFIVSTLFSGCSISYSLGKSSDSISASLDSISDSSDSSGGDSSDVALQRYLHDVIAATVGFVSNAESSRMFQKTVTSIAQHHGVVDWEQENQTYVAMGKGLKQAGVDVDTITDYAFFRDMISSDAYALIITGYHQAS